jgi:hypothetical protein
MIQLVVMLVMWVVDGFIVDLNGVVEIPLCPYQQ